MVRQAHHQRNEQPLILSLSKGGRLLLEERRAKEGKKPLGLFRQPCVELAQRPDTAKVW